VAKQILDFALVVVSFSLSSFFSFSISKLSLHIFKAQTKRGGAFVVHHLTKHYLF